MRKIVLTLFLLGLLACTDDPFVRSGNHNHMPLEFKKGEMYCVDCKMPVDSLKYSAQVVLENGDTYFFDDPGCVALWLNTIETKKSAVIWMYSLDTERWIDGRKAFYSVFDKTPMNFGFGAYEKHKPGFILYENMFIRMIRGENLTNPNIRKKLLETM